MDTIAFTERNKTTVKTTDSTINKVAVFPVSIAALFLSLAPMACPMFTVAPIARPTIITVSICITWLPMETAVVLATPSN